MVNQVTHVKIHNMNMKIEALTAESERSLSFRKHRRQRFWQILFPVGLGIVAVLVLGTLIVLSAVGGEGAGSISTWADTALIGLILPVLVFAVLIALLLVFLIYLTARVLKILPPYTFLAQQYGELIARKVRFFSDKLAAPLIGIKSFFARIGAFFLTLSGRS